MPYKNTNLNIYIRIKSSSFDNKRLQPLIWTRMAKFEKVRTTYVQLQQLLHPPSNKSRNSFLFLLQKSIQSIFLL